MEETILNMRPFKHPVYASFILAFEELLRSELRHGQGQFPAGADPLLAAMTVDPLVAAVTARDPVLLPALLNKARKQIINGPLPYDPLGDAISSFGAFVITHRRTPKTQWRMQDVLHLVKTSGELSNPVRVFVTDKEFGKIFVAGLVGREYVVPTLGILHNEGEVDRFLPPRNCIIKPTNQSGPKLLVHDNEALDRSVLKSWFRRNHYFAHREVNYKPLKAKIIVEELLADHFEVKVFCVLGKPRLLKIVKLDQRSKTGKTTDFFSRTFERLKIRGDVNPNCREEIPRPPVLDEILDLSRKLSEQFNFVRVDFYTDNKMIKVGEITNCDNAALGTYSPQGAEFVLSDHLFGK